MRVSTDFFRNMVLYASVAVSATSACSSDYPTTSPTISWDHYLDVKTIVTEAIVNSTCPAANDLEGHWDSLPDGTFPNDDCVLFPRVRNPVPLGMRLVRLAFHDATGIMDAFVNSSDPEHNGLDPAFIVMDDLYWNKTLPETNVQVCDVLSKADFFAWAYSTAVEVTVDRRRGAGDNHIPHLPVRYGRVTHDTSNPIPEEKFPDHSAHSSGEELVSYFDEKFNFTAQQAVALMGAHTLGQAERQFSGFRGVWTLQKSIFDNRYYSRIFNIVELNCTDPETETCFNFADGLELDCGDSPSASNWRCHGWEQVSIGGAGGSATVYEWRHGCDTTNGNVANCRGLMLNPDLALFYDIDDYLCNSTSCDVGEIVSFPAGSDCANNLTNGRIFATCFAKRSGTGNTADMVEDLGDGDNDLVNFLDQFAEVYDLMMQNTPETLSKLSSPAPSSAPSSTPTTPAPSAAPSATPSRIFTPRGEPCPCTAPTPRPPAPFAFECETCEDRWCGTNNNGNGRCRRACFPHCSNQRFLRAQGSDES